jgi:hypothetical protein
MSPPRSPSTTSRSKSRSRSHSLSCSPQRRDRLRSERAPRRSRSRSHSPFRRRERHASRCVPKLCFLFYNFPCECFYKLDSHFFHPLSWLTEQFAFMLHEWLLKCQYGIGFTLFSSVSSNTSLLPMHMQYGLFRGMYGDVPSFFIIVLIKSDIIQVTSVIQILLVIIELLC